MRTHMFEESRGRPSRAPINDRRSKERQDAEFKVIRYVVVLGLGTVCRGELIDESTGGIGILIDDIGGSTVAGDVVEVIYHGARQVGEIRHISPKSRGYHVGIHWEQARPN